LLGFEDLVVVVVCVSYAHKDFMPFRKNLGEMTVYLYDLRDIDHLLVLPYHKADAKEVEGIATDASLSLHFAKPLQRSKRQSSFPVASVSNSLILISLQIFSFFDAFLKKLNSLLHLVVFDPL
jgi:hypothetical protein